MGLNQPHQGLRPLHNKSKQVAKVSVNIAPGDTLLVSDGLAAQLQANSLALVDGTAPTPAPAPEPEPEAPVAEEIAPDAAEAQAAPKSRKKG